MDGKNNLERCNVRDSITTLNQTTSCSIRASLLSIVGIKCRRMSSHSVMGLWAGRRQEFQSERSWSNWVCGLD